MKNDSSESPELGLLDMLSIEDVYLDQVISNFSSLKQAQNAILGFLSDQLIILFDSDRMKKVSLSEAKMVLNSPIFWEAGTKYCLSITQKGIRYYC